MERVAQIEPEFFERLVQSHLTHVMRHQGFGLLVPELQTKTRTQRSITDEEHTRIREKIHESTKDILRMMGISFDANDVALMITVDEVPHDQRG